jgi:hypothetical protein
LNNLFHDEHDGLLPDLTSCLGQRAKNTACKWQAIIKTMQNFIYNTLQIWKMYKGIRRKQQKGEFKGHQVSTN